MIKGLVFDVDGVIAETAKIHYEIWKEIVAKIGINYKEDVNTMFKGLPRIATLKAILNYYKRDDISESEIAKMAKEKNELYVKSLNTSLSKKDLLPGIMELLDAAKAKNLRMSIASSSHNAPLILKKLEIIDYFDYIVDPSSLKKPKPDPEIYIKAAQRINLAPEECIGFEDALPGLEGLVSAKMPSVVITHHEKGDWQKANIILESTSELNLESILQKINQ